MTSPFTPEEKNKLREIFRNRCLGLESQSDSIVEFEESWDLLLDSLYIRRVSRIVHLCAPPELDEVEVEEPYEGYYLSIPRETAKKILVLGLP